MCVATLNVFFSRKTKILLRQRRGRQSLKVIKKNSFTERFLATPFS